MFVVDLVLFLKGSAPDDLRSLKDRTGVKDASYLVGFKYFIGTSYLFFLSMTPSNAAKKQSLGTVRCINGGAQTQV